MYIELFQNRRGKWQWRLMGRNGRKLATSESYDSKRNCRDTAGMVADAIMDTPMVYVRTAKKAKSKK